MSDTSGSTQRSSEAHYLRLHGYSRLDPRVPPLFCGEQQSFIPWSEGVIRSVLLPKFCFLHFTNSSNDPNCSIAPMAVSFNLLKYDMSICRSSFSLATSAS